MADPFALTSSTAGLVSLGLQIYGGLTDYLGSVKARDGDIASARHQTEILREIIQVIDSSIQDFEQQQQVPSGSVLKCVDMCNKDLAALETFLTKLTGSHSPDDGFKGKFREQKKRLTYPFHRPNLEVLEARLSRANTSLQTALQTLGLTTQNWAIKKLTDVERFMETASRDVSDTMFLLRSDVVAVHDPIFEIQRNLPSLRDDFNQLVPEMDARIGNMPSTLLENNQILMRVQNSVESQGQQMDRVEAMLKATAHDERLARIEQIFGSLGLGPESQNADSQQNLSLQHIVCRLVTRPKNMTVLSDTLESDVQQPVNSGLSITRNRKAYHVCSCNARRRLQRRQTRLGPLSIYDQESIVEQHSTDCEMSYLGTKKYTRNVGFTYSGLSKLINGVVGFSCSFGSGAAPYSISNGFMYSPTVDAGVAPAFRLLKTLSDCLMTSCHYSGIYYQGHQGLVGITEWGRLVNISCNQIIALFRNHRASPRDVDIQNRSLTHLVAGLVRACRDRTSAKYLREGFIPLLELLSVILSHGAPAVSYDINGETPLLRMTREVFFHGDEDPLLSLVNKVLSSAANISPVGIQNETFDHENYICFGSDVHFFEKSQDFAEAWGCGPLSLAILRHDEMKAKDILKKSPCAIRESNLRGQTPIHLAANQPDCLRLLIRVADPALINQQDADGMTPIQYAMYLSKDNCLNQRKGMTGMCCSGCPCAECATILLTSNCTVPFDLRYASLVFDFASQRCTVAYISSMLDRWEKLKQLARETLSNAELHSLCLKSEFPLEVTAAKISELLLKKGVRVSARLVFPKHLHGQSIYHLINSVDVADIFYQLGFTDVDVCDKYGYPPVVDTYNLRYAQWLLEHGADPFKFLQGDSSTSKWTRAPGTTTAHLIFSHISQYGINSTIDMSPTVRFTVENRDSIQVLGAAILKVDIHDECHCGCSPQGCTPLIALLKGLSSSMQRSDKVMSPARLLCDLLQILDESIELRHLVSAGHFLTFEALQLTHTCCDSNNYVRCTSDEAKEIRGLESVELELLEDLAQEFEDKVQQILVDNRPGSDTMMKFWTDYWHVRIDEELDKRREDIEPLERRKEAEKLGVVWHDEPQEEPVKDFDYWRRRIEEVVDE